MQEACRPTEVQGSDMAVGVQMRLGAPRAHCHQAQRYRVFAGGSHLVFESTQSASLPPQHESLSFAGQELLGGYFVVGAAFNSMRCSSTEASQVDVLAQHAEDRWGGYPTSAEHHADLLLLTLEHWIVCAAMTDIPFGEYFTVEQRFDVVAAPPAPDGTPCSQVRRCSTIP